MKLIGLSIISVFLLFLIIGCGEGDRAEEAGVELVSAEIKLETVKCQMCVSMVQSAAAEVRGVAGMRVDFDNKISTVSYDPSLTTLVEIEEAIANAGYHANDTERNEEIYQGLPECCK